MQSIDIFQVAKLARLHLTSDEAKALSGQLSQILSFVETLNEVKGLEKTEPTSHPFSLTDVYRADEIKPSVSIETFLKHSPASKGRFFLVPKIIEDKS